MARTHGIASTYTQAGCRCRPCTDANTAAVKSRNGRRAARLACDPDLEVVHGTVSTYRNWGCRCEPCTAANAAAGRKHGQRYRERQRDQKAVNANG